MAWVNLTEGVNLDYLKKCKVGQVLGFMNLEQGMEDERIYYKIMRIKNGKYWARRITLYGPKDFEIITKGKDSK